jgi:hypothetical protein
MSHNPVVSLVDDAGLPIKSIANGDGTATLSPTGGVATTVITYASAAQATANTGVSFSTAGMTGLAVDVTLTSFTGGSSPSVTFFVDRFGSDGVWYRVWTSSGLTGAGATSASIGPSMGTAAVLTGTARFGWSTAGSPTAVTFSASVIGR